MNKFEFDSDLGEFSSISARQIFIELEFSSSLFKNLMNELELFKTRLDSARLQSYLD